VIDLGEERGRQWRMGIRMRPSGRAVRLVSCEVDGVVCLKCGLGVKDPQERHRTVISGLTAWYATPECDLPIGEHFARRLLLGGGCKHRTCSQACQRL